MDIIPYQLSTTKDLLTSRAGLLCIGQLIEAVGFSEAVDQYFPRPKSNRGYKGFCGRTPKKVSSE